MTDYEKQLMFTMKFEGVGDEAVQKKFEWALTEKVRDLYLSTLNELSYKYLHFVAKVSLIQERLMDTKEEIQTANLSLEESSGFKAYEEMKNEVRLKSINSLQKLYTVLSNHYDRGRYDQLKLKSFDEVNQEVFNYSA